MTGQLPSLPTSPGPTPYSIPLYLAAVALQTTETGGEIAGGLLLMCASRTRLARVRQAFTRGAAHGRGLSKPTSTAMDAQSFCDITGASFRRGRATPTPALTDREQSV